MYTYTRIHKYGCTYTKIGMYTFVHLDFYYYIHHYDYFLLAKGTPVLLSPGDILYMPRGTIHEAVAQNKFSTHVTISVYQHYNRKKLLSLLIPKLLESAFQKNIEFRKGLPLRMNEKLGSFVNVEGTYFNATNDKLKLLGKDVKAENSDFEHTSWRNNLVLEVKDLVTFLSNEVWHNIVYVYT